MRTKTLLKQEPRKPSAPLDAKTARRAGIEMSSLTLSGCEARGWTSIVVSVEGAAKSGSSLAAGGRGFRLLGRVWREEKR